MEWVLTAEQIAIKIVKELVYDGLVDEDSEDAAFTVIYELLDKYQLGE